jgi:hypothetical protein
MRAAVCSAALLVALVVATGAQAALPPVAVEVDRTALTVNLGQKFAVRSTIRNRSSSSTTGPLVAHLNILALRPGTYVDPEDWSTTRTRYLPSIPAGGSTTVPWSVTAVHSGSIGVYVAVMPADGTGRPAAGPTVHATVTARETIDSGGIVPLALGVPAIIGVLALAVLARRRR